MSIPKHTVRAVKAAYKAAKLLNENPDGKPLLFVGFDGCGKSEAVKILNHITNGNFSEHEFWFDDSENTMLRLIIHHKKGGYSSDSVYSTSKESVYKKLKKHTRPIHVSKLWRKS